MRNSAILFSVLLCLCLMLTACDEPLPLEFLDTPTTTSEAPIPSEPPEGESSTVTPVSTKRSLHVSDIFFTLPSENDPYSGGMVNEVLLVYNEHAYNVAIVVQIIGEDAVREYWENLLLEIDYQQEMNEPNLYRTIHHFNISLEVLLEASDTFYGLQYDETLLRAMYLPYEEMLAVTMSPMGAILDGNVHNIQTLNELFQEDPEAFSRIALDDLIDFQERLEENGVDYGFNQDMVGFANENCR